MAVDGCQKMFKYHLPSSQTSVKIQKDERWLAAWHTSIFNYLLWNYCNSTLWNGSIVLPGQSPFGRPINPEGNFSSFAAPGSKSPFFLYFWMCRGSHEGQPLTQKRKATFTPKGRRTVACVPRSGLLTNYASCDFWYFHVFFFPTEWMS